LCSIHEFSVFNFDLSSVFYFQNYHGTVWPDCADVPLRIYSPTHSVTIYDTWINTSNNNGHSDTDNQFQYINTRYYTR